MSDSELRRIAAIADQKDKTNAYKALIDASLTEVESLKAIVSHLLDEDVLLVVSRAVRRRLALPHVAECHARRLV
ncbi:hypothetical protein P43SY_010322 [Pythium insidiosum]|uniref:Uncharacterized protein n=1 Tax=Pythium insidiosum TaxID=114742 RepID=A0AAD5L6A6_PYTIN|nr:hypothetical protein P43SY_010322 [Pythium insidiosum]